MDIGIDRRRGLIVAVFFSMGIHTLFFSLIGRKIVLPVRENGSRQPLSFEIVETPSVQTVKIPEKAVLYSDKIMRAQDVSPEGEGEMPNGRGFGHEISPAGSEGFAEPYYRSNLSSVKFSPSLLTGVPEPARARIPESGEGVRADGGIRFNTYAWDYAPYLLELKHRIEKNMFPPAVFTRWGYGGRNVIRFRILRNGALGGLESLAYEGEQVLLTTSRRAVEFSAPFRSLPEDFPESFLEVTATFNYIGLH